VTSTASGFLSRSPDNAIRLLTKDGSYVDIPIEHVVATNRLPDDPSGLSVWEIEHTADRVKSGMLDPSDLDRLFVVDDDERQLADVAADATQFVHCPATVPMTACQETRHGPCV
jgi:hypothetical protein